MECLLPYIGRRRKIVLKIHICQEPINYYSQPREMMYEKSADVTFWYSVIDGYCQWIEKR